MHKKSFYEKVIKRPQDFLCALIALIVLSPLLIILAIAVRCKLGAPVIFKQERPGRNGKIFKLYKFRTMTDKKDENGELLPDADRLTSFGRKLRSTSLDELPALINILKGDMAVVGPRPLLVRYLPLYSEEQMRRHEVRPGFTGYAQVNGRNALTWQEKFEKDVYYVDHITFAGDWKIIFQTVGAVLKKKGITSATSATMEEFTGNEPPAAAQPENSEEQFSESKEQNTDGESDSSENPLGQRTETSAMSRNRNAEIRKILQTAKKTRKKTYKIHRTPLPEIKISIKPRIKD